MTPEEFRAKIEPLCRDDANYAPHIERYVTTWRAVGSTILDVRNWPIVDCGGWSPFLSVIQTVIPPNAIISTEDCELRVGWDKPLPHTALGECGAVLCLEVLEHMHDVNTMQAQNRHQFAYSGMTALLKACWHSLRPGGRLFLTTPNVCSLASLWRLARGLDPFMYPPHVREVTPAALHALLSNAGFERIAIDSHDVWHRHGLSEAAARSCRFVAGFDPNVTRGDDLFAWAFRPEAG